MSQAREFIDFWMQNSIHATEQYKTPGSEQNPSLLAKRCVEMAAAQGIAREALEAEVGDLDAYMREAVRSANQTEVDRGDFPQ